MSNYYFIFSLQNTVISQLEQQLREFGDHDDQMPHPHKPRQEATYSLVQQQLQYGCEGVRVVELVGRVEDLTFQLSTTQEELEQANQRAAQAEVSVGGFMCSLYKLSI